MIFEMNGYQKILFDGSKLVSKWKAIEFQLDLIFQPTLQLIFECGGLKDYLIMVFQFGILGLIEFQMYWTKEQDHAGLNIDVRLIFLQFRFGFIDTRHWDDDNDCWETYSEKL